MQNKSKIDIFKQIEYHLKTSPEKDALIYPKNLENEEITYDKISYKQLDEFSSIYANYLKEKEIKKEDRVVVLVPVSLMLYITIFALIKIGAIIVFIDPWMGLEKIQKSCEICNPQAFIGNKKAVTLGMFSKTIRKIPIKVKIDKSEQNNPDFLNELKKDNKILNFKKNYKSKSLMFIRFTTGSTGEPKGAERNYEYICNLFSAIHDFFPIKKTDIDLTTLPLNIFYDLIYGATSVIPLISYGKTDDFESKFFIQQMKQCKVTTLSGSPGYLEKIVAHSLKNKLTNRKIRFIYTGGGPVSLKLVHNIKEVFPKSNSYILYGSTEVMPISWINIEDIIKKHEKNIISGKGVCVGLSHQKLKIKIDNPNEKTISGKIGEIIISGDTVIKKYFGDAGEIFSKNKIVDKEKNIWHKTGDAGYFDEKQRLWLVGRNKEIFVKNNKKIGSLMIEYIVDSLPEVKKSAFLKNKNNQLLIFVELKEDTVGSKKEDFLKEKIKKKAKENLIEIDSVIFVKKIPLDARHQTKIDYNLLKNKYSKSINK